MILSDHPSRNDINNALNGSNYTGENSMKQMNNYIFGTDNYSREAFAGMGDPLVGSTLTISYTDSGLLIGFDLINDGGLPCTVVIKWKEEDHQVGGLYFYDIRANDFRRFGDGAF